jgi:hypothetical protein
MVRWLPVTLAGRNFMNTTSRVLVALGAVTVMAGSAFAQAPDARPPQAPPGQVSPGAPPADRAQAPAAQSQTASGELVSVDAKASTLSVKTASSEMTFKYDDTTKISGGKGAAGLATMTGSQVTVQYKKDGAANIATSIDVKPAGGGAKP